MAVPACPVEADRNRPVLRLDVELALAALDMDGTILRPHADVASNAAERNRSVDRAGLEATRHTVERDRSVVCFHVNIRALRSLDNQLHAPVLDVRPHAGDPDAAALNLQPRAVRGGLRLRRCACARANAGRTHVCAAGSELNLDATVGLGLYVKAARRQRNCPVLHGAGDFVVAIHHVESGTVGSFEADRATGLMWCGAERERERTR